MLLSHALPIAVVAIVVTLAVVIVVDSLRLGMGPMPTRPLVQDALLKLLPDTPGRIFELGCGWGGLAVALSKARPDARVEGWEAAWVPWAVAALRARIQGGGRIQIHRGDLHAADVTQADVVVVYLHAEGMARLATQLRDMPPNACILSNTFGLRGWTPDETIVLPDTLRTHVYRYRVGAVHVQA